MNAYSCSKLCNILFTRELARRLHGTGVTANCLHPGFVATRFADESGGLVSRLAWLAKFFAISSIEGAETIIYLASSPDVAKVTGKYFYKCRPTTPSSTALDDRAALALWERSVGRCEGIADALTKIGSRPTHAAISERTKAALAAAKARGSRLGTLHTGETPPAP